MPSSSTKDLQQVELSPEAQQTIEDAVSKALENQAKEEAKQEAKEHQQDQHYVVTLSDESLEAIGSALDEEASSSAEVVATLSDDDQLAINVCAMSSLCLVMALCMFFGFTLINKLLNQFRVRHD